MIPRSLQRHAVQAATVALLACSGERAVDPETTREALLDALTPEMAAMVGSDGHLLLAAPPNTGRAQITRDKAGALAVALAKFNLHYDSVRLEGERRGPIAFGRLALCAPPLYALSAFVRLEIDTPSVAAHPLQKALGPFWLIKLCAGGDPQVNVAVSAYSTDLGIDTDGSVAFPPIGGNDFVPEGIPIGHLADELPSAEAAVVLAATSTGRRVAALPELVVPYYREETPSGARWHLRLDSPARVMTATGTTIESSDVYVSRVKATNRPGSRSWTADVAQPPQVDVTYIPMIRVGENWNDYLLREQVEMRTLHVPRLPATPISFTAAVLIP